MAMVVTNFVLSSTRLFISFQECLLGGPSEADTTLLPQRGAPNENADLHL